MPEFLKGVSIMPVNKKQPIQNESPFYGFLDELDSATAEQITDHLMSDAVGAIYEGDTRGQVVEEVVFRGGTLYSGIEAKEAVPWVVSDTSICAASFPYLKDETPKTASGFEERDWCVLDDIQYMYGRHLQKLIEEGTLSIEKK